MGARTDLRTYGCTQVQLYSSFDIASASGRYQSCFVKGSVWYHTMSAHHHGIILSLKCYDILSLFPLVFFYLYVFLVEHLQGNTPDSGRLGEPFSFPNRPREYKGAVRTTRRVRTFLEASSHFYKQVYACVDVGKSCLSVGPSVRCLVGWRRLTQSSSFRSSLAS